MEFSEILAASGLLGMLAAVALVALLLLVQPLWAIIDCIDSDRETDTKILVSLALFVTWGLGSLLYGLFFAVSRNLRRFTVATLALTLLLGMSGVVACGVALMNAKESAERGAELAREESARAIETFQAAPIDASAVGPFRALYFAAAGVQRSAAVADFTLTGPINASARDVSNGIRQIAVGPQGLFAITDHKFGAVSPSSGRLLEIAIEPGLADRFSWPKGIVYDAEAGQIVVMTSHVYTRFFRYDPGTAAWELLPSEHRDLTLASLAWLPEQSLLYSLEFPARASELASLRRFNASGASLGTLRLDPPIPLPPGSRDGFQLHASSGMLVLLLPPPTPGRDASPTTPQLATRIFAIDPASGSVHAPAPSSVTTTGTAAAGR